MAYQTHQTQDDAFREIQLNGKQLVFLFMVVAVVSVVIFLSGVFVGRGVRTERARLLADSSSSTSVTVPDVLPVQSVAPAPAGSDPTAAAPPPAVDELSYFNRLEKSGQAAEDVKPTAPPAARVGRPTAAAEKAATPTPTPTPAAVVPAAPAAPPVPKDPPPPKPDRPVTASSEPAGQGFALQVTALRERGEAEAIARRLSSKGYTAYVLTPPNGTPSVFRVRIGKFKTRREAEVMASRLQKEEQLTPWITR